MPYTKLLIQSIEQSNKKHRLFQTGDGLVVGVSGGPDSTALLHVLVKLRRKYGLRIHAAHLNHALLPAQARAFAERARRDSASLGVPFHLKTVDVKKSAQKSKRSVEETGRIARYAFFLQVAHKTGCNKIATAHTLDDQAETMLLRILRGSGLRGLCGIPFKRAEQNVEVVRPLLGCRKALLLNFLKENKLSYCRDKSNEDPVFARNRVRHRLLPLLEKDFNPRVSRALAALQDVCSGAQQYLRRSAGKIYRKHKIKVTRGSARLPIALIRRTEPAIASEIIFQLLADLSGDSKRFTYAQVEALLGAAHSAENGLEFRLPKNIRIIKHSKFLQFDTASK